MDVHAWRGVAWRGVGALSESALFVLSLSLCGLGRVWMSQSIRKYETRDV